MYTFLAFISIFGGVVFIHELGHFLAARSVGVKVDRFYVGFDFFGLGLKLFTDSKGTQYGLGLFPFGGYCKIHGMVDESLDTEIDNSIIDKTAFENKNTIEKLWILSAGVIMNFILAIVLSFVIFSFYGKQDQLPIINQIDLDGPAYKAGITHPNSQIIKINNQEINAWSDVLRQLNLSNINNQQQMNMIDIEYINPVTNQINDTQVLPNLMEIDYYYPIYMQLKDLGAIEYLRNGKRLIAFIDIGIEPLPQAYILPFISEVVKGSPAEEVGIPPGSYITKMNDTVIEEWDDIVMFLLNNQNQDLLIEYEFNNKLNQVNITPNIDGKLGIIPSMNKINIIPENIIFKNMSLSESFISAFKKPISDLSLQLWGFGQIISGNMGFDGVGGPVKITQEAGKAARYGTPYFLGFMATISTILGFMNILPIPGLDGGHAFMTIIEGVTRRKIPINIKVAIQSIAILFLLSLTVIILFNDIRNLL